MKIRSSKPHALTAAELTACFAPDGQSKPPHASLAAAWRSARATGDLKTEFRAQSMFHPAGKGPRRLLCIGLGKPDATDTERLRRAAALAQVKAEQVGVAAFALAVRDEDRGKVAPEAAGRAVAEGLILGAYKYEPPSKRPGKPRRAQRAEVVYGGQGGRDFAAGLRAGVIAAEATAFARDLAEGPGNRVTPSFLAAAAKRLESDSIRVTILRERDMKRLGMGALLGVAQGSAEPARLIVLDHKPAGAREVVCVVGKGLTFDTGGISIKPSAKMEEMRYDMCGGAAVLGLFAAIRAGALAGSARKRRVVGIIPATENMPGGAAQRPGDVVTACDGTTIEVLNTDAEGRLILGDAIAYAKKTYRPACVVDIATLTGAVITALGHELAAVLGNDDALADELIAAGSAADEPLWRLPLWDVHKEATKSKYADLANIVGPATGAGTIAGAAFLSSFTDGTPWAHLDIAGTAWGGVAKDYYKGGASGFGVRCLVQWLLARR
jgi:leucyl aminopeptidase